MEHPFAHFNVEVLFFLLNGMANVIFLSKYLEVKKLKD